MARTRNWWVIHTTAGVAAVLLTMFGVAQCSQKNNEQFGKNLLNNTLNEYKQALDSATVHIKRVNDANKRLDDDNRAKADTIRMQRDSIIVLNDSLDVVNAKLTDCRNSGKKAVPVKPKPQPKPQPKDTVCVGVLPEKKVPEYCPPHNAKNVVVLDSAKNNGNVVVEKNACGDTEITLKNGAVNNGNIVVGNNNNVIINRQDSVIRFIKTREVIIECEFQTTRRVYK